MDAKDYLIKINLICNEFRMRCDDCPLETLYCGYPANKYDIEQTIEVVEKYDIPNEETVKWEDGHCGGYPPCNPPEEGRYTELHEVYD